MKKKLLVELEVSIVGDLDYGVDVLQRGLFFDCTSAHVDGRVCTVKLKSTRVLDFPEELTPRDPS